MATKSNIRITLFDRLAQNFNYIKEAFPNLGLPPKTPDVICPICMNIITLDPEEPSFATIEHAPSAKLGGKIIGLTCKNCNSTQGSSLDSKLIEYYKISQSFKSDGTNSIDAKVRLNNLPPVNVKFKVTANNSWRLIPLEQNSDPKILANLNHLFEQTSNSSVTNLSLNIQINHPHPRTIRIALIRAAYLIAFGQFGYGFIVNPALNYVRNLLLEPENENLYPHGVIFNFPTGDENLGISIITEPVEMRAYLVVFDIFEKNKRLDRVGVILPGWSETPVELYNYLNSINGQQIQLFTHKIIDKIDFLKDSPLAALGHWNMLFP